MIPFQLVGGRKWDILSQSARVTRSASHEGDGCHEDSLQLLTIFNYLLWYCACNKKGAALSHRW